MPVNGWIDCTKKDQFSPLEKVLSACRELIQQGVRTGMEPLPLYVSFQLAGRLLTMHGSAFQNYPSTSPAVWRVQATTTRIERHILLHVKSSAILKTALSGKVSGIINYSQMACYIFCIQRGKKHLFWFTIAIVAKAASPLGDNALQQG